MKQGFKWYICWLLLSSTLPSMAQSYLGIRTTQQQLLPHFAIVLNGKQALRSNAEGIIQLDKPISKAFFNKSSIEVLSEEYLLYQRDTNTDTLWIEVEKCHLMKGKVKTKNNFPLAGIRILHINQEGTQPVVSDEHGNFLLRVFSHKTLKKNEIIAFDISFTRLDLDYDIKVYPDSSMELIIEKTAQTVQKVLLLDEDEESLSQTPIFIDGKEYFSDTKGQILLRHPTSELSAFYGQAMQVLKLEYLPEISAMKVYLYTPDNPQIQFKTVHLGNRWVKNKD